MAKVTILSPNITTEELKGFTAKQYTALSKAGRAIKRLTATNDFLSFDSGFVNDNSTWFAVPSQTVYEEDGETVKSRYEQIELDKTISTGLLKYTGEHKPLALRTPNLDEVEFIFCETTNENQIKWGSFYKLTVKGDGWTLPNVSLFKRASGEIVIGNIPGITLHPALALDIIKSAYDLMKDKVIETSMIEEVKSEVEELLNTDDVDIDEEVIV